MLTPLHNRMEVKGKETFDVKLFKSFSICIGVMLSSLLISIVLAEIFFAACAILFIVLLTRGYSYNINSFDIIFILFLTVRAITVICSEYWSTSAATFWTQWVFFTGYFFSSFFFQHANTKYIRNVFRSLIISTIIVSFISIALVVLDYVQRANGLSGGGTLATHLVYSILLLLFVKDEHKIISSRIVYWGSLIVFLLALALTQTRGDWIAAAVVITCFGIRFNRKMLLYVLLFATVIVIALPSIRSRLETLASPLSNTSDRLTLWQHAVPLIKEHPWLGHGPGTFSQVFLFRNELVDKGVASWHNDMIQVTVESGLLGLASFTVLFISVIRMITKNKNPAPIRGNVNVRWFGLLLILAHLIIGTFGVPTISITNGLLFRFFIAFVITSMVIGSSKDTISQRITA